MVALTDYVPQAAGNLAPAPAPISISGGVQQSVSGNLSASGEIWWLVGAVIGGALFLHWLG